MFTIVLTVILIMGPDKDDIQQHHEMASAEECWSAARAWIEQDARAAGAGVVGFAAACASTPKPGRDG